MDLETERSSKQETVAIRELSNIQVVKDIYAISAPLIMCLFVTMSMYLFNVTLIGHLGTEEDVAGAGMANMLMNIISNSLMQGIA